VPHRLSILFRRLAGLFMSSRMVQFFLGLGIFLRVFEWARHSSLWLDEAMLALNLMHRGFGDFCKPLDYDQGAPLFFLWTMKGAIMLLGPSEHGLRLIPLLAAIGSLLIFSRVVPYVLRRPEATLALGLFAMSCPLIVYSGEVKQYSCDVFFSALILWLALKNEKEGWTPRRYFLLIFAGALGIWFSHPLIFMLGGVGGALLLSALWRRKRAEICWLFPANGLWLASFGLNNRLMLAGLAANPRLHQYWAMENAFMPLGRKTPAWLLESFIRIFSQFPMMPGLIPFAGVLFVLGHWGLARERRKIYGMLCLPIVLALAASALQKYPFQDRLLLFLYPILVLFLLKGLEWLRLRDWWLIRVPAYALAMAMLVNISYFDLHRLHVSKRADIALMIKVLGKKYQPGDHILINFNGCAFQYYVEALELKALLKDRAGRRNLIQIGGTVKAKALDHFVENFVLSIKEPRSRLWVITGSHKRNNYQDAAQISRIMKSRGARLLRKNKGGASLCLFEIVKQ
jgi:hypothetical protein